MTNPVNVRGQRTSRSPAADPDRDESTRAADDAVILHGRNTDGTAVRQSSGGAGHDPSRGPTLLGEGREWDRELLQHRRTQSREVGA